MRGVAILAACTAALAIWLWPASVHIVDWPAEGPQRIAVFPPIWRFWALLAAPAAIGWFAHSRAGLKPRHVRSGPIIAPLLWLALCAIPYLPWLPDRIPALLVLAGPLKWIVAAAAVAAVAVRWFQQSSWHITYLWEPTRTFIFGLALLLYLVFGLRSLAVVGLKGDEPHYVIIAQSLLADGDLRIENNHRQREYRSFTREELPPDFMQRGANGEIYSIHAPGLPALLLLPYAAAGAIGVIVSMCVFAALAVAAIYALAAHVAGPGAGLATATAIALSVPFNPYAWAVFPEIAGAAIVAWGALWLAEDRAATARSWLARGACLALLPWLHTKFIIFLAGFSVLLLMRLRRQPTLTASLLTPIGLSVVAWLASFYAIYGTPNPEAPYGTYARDWVKLENVPRGLLGLLVDQKFGLLVYAPVYLLLPFGLWIAWRDRRWRWPLAAMAAIALAFTVSSARLYMWWGGWSAPARFLVPVLPLLAPALALAFAAARGPRRIAAGVLLGVSLTISLASATAPGELLLFSDAHGVARLVERVQGAAPLTATLPTFTESEWRARDLIPRAYPEQARRDLVVRGRIALMDHYDPDGRWAFDYATRRRLDATGWMRAGTLTPGVASHLRGALAYLDDQSYPEGDTFWTRGTERAQALVASEGRSRLTVIVHVGPGGGPVRLRVGGRAMDIPMAPDQTRSVDFDVPPDAARVPIAVQASSAFRPSEVDPNSQDHRLLGAQIRVVFR